MSTTFQLGDRATWDAIPHEVGTVLSVTDRGVALRYPDDDTDLLPKGHLLRASACSHVPVTAEHVGQWARNARDADGSVGLVTKVDRAWVTLSARGGEDIAVVKPWAAVVIADPANRPVPADQPDPAQDTGPEQWRVGGNYGIHAYAVGDPWEYDGNKDRPVGTFHRPEDAARAVAAVNGTPRLEQWAQKTAGEWVAVDARLTRSRRALARVKAERDAARAELAAARAHDTDGLDRMVVRAPGDSPRMDGTYRYGLGYSDRPGQFAWFRATPETAALLRARLTDEATPAKNGAQ